MKGLSLKYRVVAEGLKDRHDEDEQFAFQVAVYGPSGLVSIPMKYVSKETAIRYADNIRYAFEAGFRELSKVITTAMFNTHALAETEFPTEV